MTSRYFLPLEKRHTHDCDACVYYGSTLLNVEKHADWYFCPKSDSGSVIKRFSSKGSNYASAPISIHHASIMQEAAALGILKWHPQPPPDPTGKDACPFCESVEGTYKGPDGYDTCLTCGGK